MTRRTALAGALLLIAGGLLALEGWVRYRESQRPVVNPTAQYLYYPHARLQRALVRDADYFGHLHVNHFGFRGPDVPLRKPAGTTRIIAVGASATFDPCASDDRATWTAQLDRALHRLVPGRAFEVLNAGVPGYLMLDNIIRLHSELYAFSPDIILIYAGHGAISPGDAQRLRMALPPGGDSVTPGVLAPATPWGGWLTRHSYLYARLGDRIGAASRRVPALPTGTVPWDSVLRQSESDFQRDLTSFVAIARGIGARVVVAELATMTDLAGDAPMPAGDSVIWQRAFGVPPSVAAEGFRRFSAVQRAVASAHGGTFIATRDFGIRGPENFCTGDPIHFSHAGSARMGARMAEALLARGALPSSGLPNPD